MNQPDYILTHGTAIRTHAKLGTTEGMSVMQRYLDARCPDAIGTIRTPVPGHGGDVYFVQHGPNMIAVYCFDEFELVDEAS